jgi:hypothetical protein
LIAGLLLSVATPWTTMLPGVGPTTARLAVMLRTVVSSMRPALVPAITSICTLSPGRMSGVLPNQQEPPGWFTSTMPLAPAGSAGSVERAEIHCEGSSPVVLPAEPG